MSLVRENALAVDIGFSASMFSWQCSPHLCDSAGLALEHTEVVLLEVQDRDQLTEGVLLVNLFRVGHGKV